MCIRDRYNGGNFGALKKIGQYTLIKDPALKHTKVARKYQAWLKKAKNRTQLTDTQKQVITGGAILLGIFGAAIAHSKNQRECDPLHSVSQRCVALGFSD